MARVRDQIVFLTGASAGIGAATARQFHAAGARVVLAARRRERVEALATELGERALAVSLDVRDRGSIDRAVGELPPDFAAISVLVNNAGLALGLGPLDALGPDDTDTVLDTNIKGLVACTQAILPGMLARGRGHIVNLGSVAGTYPYPGGHVYSGSKAFVHQFSLALRADLLGKNVRVTCLEPGMVESDFSRVRFGGDEARASAIYENFEPLTPDDIAATIVWCASLPPRVNVNTLELMPVNQAFSPFAVRRG